MGTKAGQEFRKLMPPQPASAILEILLPAELRDAIVGDLHEEYLSRRRASASRAWIWYWAETFRSLTRFPGIGLTATRVTNVALVAYLLSVGMEFAVAQPVARTAANGEFSWTTFYLAQVLAFAAVSGFAAVLLHRPYQSLMFNALMSAAPFSLLLATPLVVMAYVRKDLYFLLDRSTWIAASAASAAIGALAGATLVRFRRMGPTSPA